MALYEDFSSKELLVFVVKNLLQKKEKKLNYFIISHKFNRKGRSAEYFIIL